jgi:CheY-like chemotaxis protein
MNLAVNARDAMPGGGTLVIETAGEPLHPWPAASKSEARTGPAVRLSVSDTGKGMDKATLKNIFEPFFTTKGTKGTGLGLATVYGIVQQHQGSIDVVSEPDKGTTFRIYLPQVDATPERDAGVTDGSVPVRGTGTVLVVEDQEEVRGFVVQALRERGYDVLSAGDGEQAISTAAQHSGNIDVLLTDVVLPGINGREVAERLKHARSSLKVIYTSGYTQDLIADRGVLHSDVSFVPKPYTAEQIAAKVRETLQPD